jgi:hypothetical protein
LCGIIHMSISKSTGFYKASILLPLSVHMHGPIQTSPVVDSCIIICPHVHIEGEVMVLYLVLLTSGGEKGLHRKSLGCTLLAKTLVLV